MTELDVWEVGPQQWWVTVRGTLIPCDQSSYWEGVFSDGGQFDMPTMLWLPPVLVKLVFPAEQKYPRVSVTSPTFCLFLAQVKSKCSWSWRTFLQVGIRGVWLLSSPGFAVSDVWFQGCCALAGMESA